MLDEPAILTASETVQQIVEGTRRQVITDKNVYNINDVAELSPAIMIGAVLPMGTLLTQTVRIYDNLDVTRLSAGTPYGERFRRDILSLCLPPAFFRAPVQHGLGITWQASDIIYCGQDANGNAKLRFTLYGDTDDIEKFWQDFWDYCERNKIDGQACFTAYLRDSLPEVVGVSWGKLAPLEYMLDNYLKSNLLVIVVDVNRLSVAGRNSLNQVTLLRSVIPASVTFFVVEQTVVPKEEYDMGSELTDTQRVPLYVSLAREVAGPDEYPKGRMVYRDARPVIHWIPVCPGV
jgi:hypothetical protein